MRLLIIIILTLFATSLKAQDSTGFIRKNQKKEIQTLFGNARPVGGFLGTSIKATEINQRPGILMGSELALVLGHKFNFGITGYGLITDITSDAFSVDGNSYYLTMGYGGLYFEPIIASHKLLHLTIPLTIGIGGLGLNEHRLISDNNTWNYATYGVDYDFFLLAETGLNIELNVFKVLRIDFGVSYRFVEDVQLLETNNSDIKGFNTNITLKVGAF